MAYVVISTAAFGEMTMDDLDDHLLSRLRDNARAPVAELARALGLSRTTVQSRLARLERTGVIAEMDYVDVAGARVSGLEPIPRLEELLLAWPEIRINIDPKRDNAVAPLIRVLKSCNALDRVCVTSFSGARTQAVREALGPDLCTGLGPMATIRLRLSSWCGPAGALWGGFVEGCAQIPVAQHGLRLVDPMLVARAHDAGLQVHVWTIDDPAEMNRLIDLGVDGLMTDQPAVLKAVLVERGLWTS